MGEISHSTVGREKWGALTDDDLEYIAGRRDRLVGKIQERYGLLREEAQKTAEEWVKSIRDDIRRREVIHT